MRPRNPPVPMNTQRIAVSSSSAYRPARLALRFWLMAPSATEMVSARSFDVEHPSEGISIMGTSKIGQECLSSLDDPDSAPTIERRVNFDDDAFDAPAGLRDVSLNRHYGWHRHDFDHLKVPAEVVDRYGYGIKALTVDLYEPVLIPLQGTLEFSLRRDVCRHHHCECCECASQSLHHRFLPI